MYPRRRNCHPVSLASMIATAMLPAIARCGQQPVGPFPTGRPTYGHVAAKQLPPVASSGRECVPTKYVDIGAGFLGGFVAYQAKGAGDHLEQEVEVATDGRNEVVLWMPKGPRCGMFVVVVDDERLGPELDGYAQQAEGPQPVEVGEVDLTAGTHRVKLLVTGQNAESRGHELWIDAYLVRRKPEGQPIGDWQVAGPFADRAPAPPKDAQWQVAFADQGVLDLGKQLTLRDNVSGWARTTISSPQAQDAMLWLGSDDGVSVWLNGAKVHEYAEERPALPDQDRIKVRLKQGDNQLLCRVDNAKYDWHLTVRPHDPQGQLTVVVPDLPRPKPADLGNRVNGFVVWESNRAGQWQLYRVNTDGSDFRQLSTFPRDPLAFDSYLRPRVSPDGTTLLFAYGRKHRPCETWTIPATGGEAQKLTVGNPLNWSADGTKIFFLRDNRVWQRDVPTGTESLVNGSTVAASGKEGGTVGTLRPDFKSVVMRSPQRNEYYVFGTKDPVKTMGGCESQITADGRHVYWVQGPKDFRVWEIGTQNEHQLLGQPKGTKWNYTYFPTVSTDSRWLAYGASPGQHSHSTSDYEIYVHELRNLQPVGMPVRLSNHPKTDRWPYLWIRN